MNISTTALRAHNNEKEDPCFNEEYNKTHKLGTMEERITLKSIVQERDGICSNGRDKLTKAYIHKYTEHRVR